MAKSGPTPDDIMASAEFKPILMKSKQEPVSCALALTAEKEGVLLLHKKTKPRKLMGSLKAEATKIKLNLETASFRFGTVEVDPEVDAALVIFRVNKGVPGTFDAKFRERTKKAGFAKVQFIVDELLNEEEEEGDAAETAQPGDGATTAEPDWGGLNKALGGLIGGIKGAAGSNADMLKSLSKLANDAAAAVTAKLDFGGASGLVEKLKEALGGGGAPAASGAKAEVRTGTVAYAKSRLAWLATRKKLESEIQKLEAEIIATYEDEGLGQELAGAYASWVNPVMTTLDERLADALDAATNAGDEGERTKLVGQAKAIIGEYQIFLADPRIAELDDNPFVKLAIRTTVGGTLSTLEKAIV